jgi:KDO2-lipid IV(A) lauroyltransferase
MNTLLDLLAALPARLGYALASAGYILVYYLFRYRRDTVRENLRCAFPELAENERKQIERRFYRHFCDLVVEILRAPRMTKDEFVARMPYRNVDALRDATNDFEKQAIILLAHQGNWEWMLPAAMAQLPVPADPVYKPLHSPFWDAYMLKARSRFGATPMAMSNVGREVIRGRKRKRLIVMLADQSGPRAGGYWIDFLNRPASFHRGADKLAMSLSLPVFFAECRRLARGQYEVVFHELCRPPYTDTEDSSGEPSILERYVRMTESMIRKQPETYLWTNRRWKKAPPEDLVRT